MSMNEPHLCTPPELNNVHVTTDVRTDNLYIDSNQSLISKDHGIPLNDQESLSKDKAIESKNQQKKRLRHELYLVKKTVRTKERREKALKKKELKRAQLSNEQVNTSVKKANIILNDITSFNQESRSIRRRQEFLEKCRNNPMVIIDCGFQGLQTAKELTSLSQQLMFTYGYNRKAEQPFNLVFCGLFQELLNCLSRVSGYTQWVCEKINDSCPIFLQQFSGNHPKTTSNSCLLHSSPIQNIIYLTADSDVTLSKIEPDTIYIIGGLVDRNRYPGITVKRASEWNIKTAKLPIQDYLKLTGSKVLTVNQVYAILERFYSLNDWNQAFQDVIPLRKMIPQHN